MMSTLVVSPTKPKLSASSFSPSTISLQLTKLLKQYLLASIYLCVVVGSYVALVTVGYPKARASSHVADYHLMNGHIVFVAAVLSWLYTMQTSPGTVTPETRSLYDHYDHDELLYRSDDNTDRIPRSKYDRFKYKAVIPRFDHYCGWVGNTIGEENYRTFLGFVLTQYCLVVYASILIFQFFAGDLQDSGLSRNARIFELDTGKEFQVTYWILANVLWIRHPCEMVVLSITGIMSLLLTYFLLYHCRIASSNITTNEDYKWQKVRKWHESRFMEYELYRYKKSQSKQQQQQQHVSKKRAKPLAIPETDVGCTGGIDELPLADEKGSDLDSLDEEEEEEPKDPGPMPTNRYDKGFLENWKEVLWPISLRKKAASKKRKAP